jgi:hypothetical protein
MTKKEEKKEEIDPDLKEFLHAPLSLEEMEKKRRDEESMKRANLRHYYKVKEKEKEEE